MDFDAYLISKKIDPENFRKGEPDRYRAFADIFPQMHPESFTAQKLFLINHIRRTYSLEKQPEEQTVKQPQKVKPKVVMRKSNPK